MSAKWPPPILLAAHVDDGVVGVELAAHELVRLEDGHHPVDPRTRFERHSGQLLAVADGADHRDPLAHRDVGAGAHFFDAGDDMSDLLVRSPLVHDDHHAQWSSLRSVAPRPRAPRDVHDGRSRRS